MRKNSIVVGRILSGSCVGKAKNVDFFLSKNALLDFWERRIPNVETSPLETQISVSCAGPHPTFPAKFHAKRRR